MHPRPILKAASPALDLFNPPLPESSSSSSAPLPFTACTARSVFYSPHVHFPSTPGLTLTVGAAHSPGTYDRAPIAVSPNSCAMPARGDRVYGSPAAERVAPSGVGSYFHPRAFEACELEPVPALHPDLSSETDEWSSAEECASPTAASPESDVAVAVRVAGTPRFASSYSPAYPTPIPSTHTQAEFDHALSFLPHPPVLEKRRRSPGRRPRRPGCTFETDGAESESCLGGF
ncbi:hypothetical protein C8R46DRAFT_1293883 [Mycena filopes]|nr:hypothetical protein C8R46DRAFT_1293883 [Mycena filopes]